MTLKTTEAKMIIDTSYQKKVLKIDLTIGEIENIIDELERVPHNVYEFLNHKKTIEKLKSCLDSKPSIQETEDKK